MWTLVLAQAPIFQTIRDVETAASSAAKPSSIKMQPQISQDGSRAQGKAREKEMAKRPLADATTRVAERRRKEKEAKAGGITKKTNGEDPA